MQQISMAPTKHIQREMQDHTMKQMHGQGLTWQPTPMNRSFLTSRASTVARVLRLGESVGLTPLALMMSSLHLATTWTSTQSVRQAAYSFTNHVRQAVRRLLCPA